MFRLCEACNGYSFYFLARLINNLILNAVLASYYLKLSLSAFLECFLLLDIVAILCANIAKLEIDRIVFFIKK